MKQPLFTYLMILSLLLTAIACKHDLTPQQGTEPESAEISAEKPSEEPEIDQQGNGNSGAPDTQTHNEPVPPQPQTPENEPPLTKPPEVKPPAILPPEVNPPETQPPETEPPTVKPPESEQPETDPPEIEPPETEPPAL